MKRKIFSLLTAVILGTSMLFNIPVSAAPSAIPAFPGAEGGGKYTSGGRGCEVYIVDTLEDYGEDEKPIKGSLRDAVSEDNRTIVFNVSGVIELKQKLLITNRKNITIAGQTAPGNGITIYGYETNISNSENMIIRYLRFRPGAKNVHSGDSMDAIWGRSMKNIMIDHLSTSWSTDETMSLYRAENMTVQWSIIAESLAMSGHTKGRHGYGAIWGGVNTTYHHNLIANHTSRNPRMGGGTPEADDNEHIANFDMRNNVIYNWGFNTIYGGGRSNANFINNYEKPGPGTRENVKNRMMDAGEKNKPGSFYLSGNILEGSSEITEDNSKGIYISEESKPSTVISDKEFKMDGTKPENLKTQTAEKAYEDVLLKVGAVYPKRDALDARILANVKNGTGRYANKDEEVGGLPYTESEKRADDFDTDRDGMADEWEIKNGLDPKNPEDSKDLAKNNIGYTNLEIYLNSIVDMDYSPDNPVIELSAPVYNQNYNTGDTIILEADTFDKDGIEKVEFYNGSTKIATVKEAPYKYELNGLKDGTYFISAKVTDKKGFSTQSDSSAIHVTDKTDLSGWKTRDIGNPSAKGSTSVYNEGKEITVKGGGKLTGVNDSFHYTYQKINGNFEISAKIDSVSAVDNHAFGGIMVRENLNPSSPAVGIGLSWTKAYSWKEKNAETEKETTLYRNPWSIYLVGRNKTGEDFDILDENLDSPESAEKTGIALKNDIPFKDLDKELGYYIMLKREGNIFTAYTSENGENWEELGQKTVKMNDAVYIGFAADGNQVSNQLHNLNTVKFSEININKEDI